MLVEMLEEVVQIGDVLKIGPVKAPGTDENIYTVIYECVRSKRGMSRSEKANINRPCLPLWEINRYESMYVF